MRQVRGAERSHIPEIERDAEPNSATVFPNCRPITSGGGMRNNDDADLARICREYATTKVPGARTALLEMAERYEATVSRTGKR